MASIEYLPLNTDRVRTQFTPHTQEADRRQVMRRVHAPANHRGSAREEAEKGLCKFVAMETCLRLFVTGLPDSTRQKEAEPAGLGMFWSE